ncbi:MULTISPECIES: hypothetical protein [Bacillus cereus group]|uniref:hypothetical protein n=1 Tax=Bacillus cereus group TaxID=86661 RepID=UPI0011A94F66|nr:hypothetical protein [Bacillus thuringiensis]
MLKISGRIIIILATIIAMILSYRFAVDRIEGVLTATIVYCIGSFMLLCTIYLEIIYDEKK